MANITLHENRHLRLEREPLRYWKGDGKVIFTRPFLMLGKVTFDEYGNALELSCRGDISYIVTNFNGSLSKTGRSLNV